MRYVEINDKVIILDKIVSVDKIYECFGDGKKIYVLNLITVGTEDCYYHFSFETLEAAESTRKKVLDGVNCL